MRGGVRTRKRNDDFDIAKAMRFFGSQNVTPRKIYNVPLEVVGVDRGSGDLSFRRSARGLFGVKHNSLVKRGRASSVF